MEESRELKQLFTFLQGAVYASVVIEVLMFVHFPNLPEPIILILQRLAQFSIYRDIYLSKAVTLLLIVIVSVGSRPKKSLELKILRQIILPLFLGLILIFVSVFFLGFSRYQILFEVLSVFDAVYIFCSFIGAVLVHIALDNVSKQVKSGLMRDRFNIENESFDQERRLIKNPYSVNVPTRFYYQHKMHKGWLNIVNPFRGTLLIGTPGSGKTYSIIVPAIKQHLAKGFSMVLYDFKYPDLAKVAYHHYQLQLKSGKLPNFRFHVINLNRLEKSRRLNPLKAMYISTMASAAETAEALIEALRKSDGGKGADQFFSQSAVNFLAAIIYYFSRYEGGKYATLAHVMAFTNHSYEDIFDTLHRAPELQSLLAPFKSAYEKRAFDQLEGQIGTLRINLSRLATKEAFWIFSGDDVPLGINDPEHPSVLVLANDPETQNINSACYAVVLNRLIRQLNRKDKLPCSMIIDEVPTVYIHKIENLLATARSNKVSILLGLQELPQFRQQYGKEAAETICSVAANVLSGAVQHKDTLMWLEKLFGKIRQLRNGISVDRHRTSVSVNEYMDFLIPASRIANLKTGELVGHLAAEGDRQSYHTNSYNCKISLNSRLIRKEEKLYTDTPDYYDFGENKEEILEANMQKIADEVKEVVYGS
jgi:hypothetical protein